MTAKIKYCILIVTITLAFSCNKLLEVDVPDNLVHNEFWQNRNQVFASLIGLYTSVQGNLNSYQIWGDIRSSLYEPGPAEAFTTNHAQFLSHDIYPDNSLLSWSAVYKSIGWINSFIKNAPQGLVNDPTFKEEELKTMMGEAYGLRALNYFYLVRAFKEVPLITEPYESDNQQVNTIASPESAVLDLIEADLTIALAQAPETFEDVTYRNGRITKNALRALWADVMLWKNDYQGVLTMCAPLDQQYQSRLLAPLEWYSIFNPGNSVETILELQHVQTGPASPVYNWFANFSTTTGGATYLANPVNLQLANSEVLYPTALPGYASSDTIRFKEFSSYRLGTGVANGYGNGVEVYKFLGQQAYQLSYRPNNDRRTVNYILYRYREVLFMKAEALAMLNRYAEAEEMINLIREHCNIPLLNPGEGGEGDEFFSRLLMEREAELGFEGKEWFAAVRVARRAGMQNVLLNKSATNNSMGYSYQVIRARLLNPESWFLPYHRTEIENNPKLQQKDYYKNK